MSIIAEFFVSTSEAASSFDAAAWPKTDMYQSGGLIPMHLELLWAILEGREWDVEMGDAFTPVGPQNTDSSWLVRFPDALVLAFEQASLAQLDQARIEWANTEEMMADPNDLVEVMAALQGLARNARSTGRSIFLYGSL
jgi:hypothetical protein